MKKFISVILGLLVFTSIAYAAMSYECWRYVNGKPEGYISVTADSREEAETKAYARFKELGSQIDYCKCK
ncbi:MAG: hypothetical protein HQK67_01665 [Desulfamplus sp.]|nr:hypothetical protein [Desulfamplus sp.]